MRLSRASRYALHALAHMAKSEDAKPQSTKAIAEALGIPFVYLLKSLKPCVAKGFVGSFTGPHGGYYWRRDPKAVTVLDVVEAVDGPMIARHDADGGVDRVLAGLVGDATKAVKGIYGGTSIKQLSASKRKGGRG